MKSFVFEGETLPIASKCQTQACPRDADFMVHWPGQPTTMCVPCTSRAENVAVAMGFTVAVEPIEVWFRTQLEKIELQRRVKDASSRLDGTHNSIGYGSLGEVTSHTSVGARVLYYGISNPNQKP